MNLIFVNAHGEVISTHDRKDQLAVIKVMAEVLKDRIVTEVNEVGRDIIVSVAYRNSDTVHGVDVESLYMSLVDVIEEYPDLNINKATLKSIEAAMIDEISEWDYSELDDSVKDVARDIIDKGDFEVKNYLIMGAPASGKGSISRQFVDKYDVVHISTGDLLRKEIKDETKLGEEIKDIIHEGNLVSDEIISKLLKKALTRPEVVRRGFLLDGYPRTKKQVFELEKILKELDMEVDHALMLVVPDRTLINRVEGRLVCPECNSIYHKETLKPLKEGVCDRCEHDLVRREEDQFEVFYKRLEEYKKLTRDAIVGHMDYATVEYIAAEYDVERTMKIIKEKIG